MKKKKKKKKQETVWTAIQQTGKQLGITLSTDGSFDETTEFGDPDNLSTWNLFNLADHDPNGGKAEFSVVDGVLNAEIQQVGWNWWQMQLFQNLNTF
ncbi:MAG: hypothetical protein U5K84_06685 [Alkalibacterium sp.]|nr:hypothetical protein [Alkalibacterium sp.]